MATGASADAELISVSIIAGPAADRLVDKLTAGGPTSSKVFRPTPGSTPEELITGLKAIARRSETTQLLVQCEPETPAMGYASLFSDPPTSLSDLFRLTAVAFAIDPGTLLDALLARKRSSMSSCFFAEQLEFASEIFLGAGGDKGDFELARAIAASLNPRARFLALADGALIARRDDWKTIFDFERALNDAPWRKLLDDEEPTSSSDDRVVAFGYHARRPFHPKRFWQLLEQGLPGLFRAKGFFWLATRMGEVGGLNLAGSELQCASAGQWWAARDAETRASEMPERTRKQWLEPFGDRRQSIALMALGVDEPALRHSLDACLLSDAEMTEGPEQWRDLPDPFPSWTQHQSHTHSHPHAHDEHCHHHHDHDPQDHYCCHH